jgi:DNA phosphorothioation-associated putative methyltransferase
MAFSRRLEFREDLIDRFRQDIVAERYVRLATQLGRLPRSEEFEYYGRLTASYGSSTRVQRLTNALVNPREMAASREERRSDMLVFGALLRLQGIAPPQFKTLPESVQADVKALWGSYARALREAEQFLASVGNPEVVRAACDSTEFGKRLPGHIYVHRSAEEDLPALLRVIVFAAKRIVGELSYDLTKIGADGRAVSFLSYPGFDEVGHPRLTRSVRVYLPKATAEWRDYTRSSNPPILHRKDALVSPGYPYYNQFRALTTEEEAAGLLSNGDIGTLLRWESLLYTRGLRVVGHRLVSL